MAAATLAHRRFCGCRDLQVGTALKAHDLSLGDGRVLFFQRWPGRFLLFQSEMRTALLANRRVRASRLRLHMAALGTRDRNLILRRGSHSEAEFPLFANQVPAAVRPMGSAPANAQRSEPWQAN